MPGNEVLQGPVRNLHPFGRSGGTGGVQDVGEVLRIVPCREVILREAVQQAVVEQQLTRARMRNPRGECSFRNDKFRTSGFQNGGYPRLRVGRVHREAGPARLQDRQHGNNQLRRPLKENPHRLIRLDPAVTKLVRQPVGPAVQFGIGHPPAIHLHGNPVTIPLSLLLEEDLHLP